MHAEAAAQSALDRFHPVVRAWFRQRYGTPTDVQNQAWDRIARGEHVLVTAPTGSGKTLAAFLWALDELLSRKFEGGVTHTLYVSPLRALNNDIRRNLLAPLEELLADFARQGLEAPPIQVVTRSSDTPTDERNRMARRPPEILITTPESLNILLTSQRGRRMLASVCTVILDEVHAVAGSKRGVHLITAVERLALLCGEFQRIALSATVRPHAPIARWVGGWQRVHDDEYRARDVHVIDAGGGKRYELDVLFPGTNQEAFDETERSTIWPGVVSAIRTSVRRHRSTLVFANSRRMVEKLARLVNEGDDGELVYAHHGSLSREIRHLVETRLKHGQIRGIVATSSLELGIDIGSLDEVILVQTPPSVASTVQRIGRAGHAVGETSRARFLPLLPRDALNSAVVARAVLDGAIEPLRPVRGALDVLAQIIVSAVAAEQWAVDELFASIRCADSYHDLSRQQFDLVLDMLAGRYSAARVRELEPVLSIDRVRDVVVARPGAAMRVYMAGGTIPDRGYFRLRRSDSNAIVGELDEEFVWERSIGDTFTLGVQSWRISDITHNDVIVAPAPAGASMAPFWRAESRDRSFELSELIGLFLEEAESALQEPAWLESLVRDYHVSPTTADMLVAWLGRQRTIMGGRLPHRHRVVLERVVDPQGHGRESGFILHTTWGGRVNRPFALALQSALTGPGGVTPQVMHDDDCIQLSETGDLRIAELFDAVRPERLLELLRKGLETTGYYGARFREAAGRALLLPRAGFHRRTPLWLSRMRAKKLLDTVSRFDDFPLRLEAWRECMLDAFDTEALRRLLDEVRDGTIAIDDVTTSSPSPFAASVTWKQTNQLMYDDDTPDVKSSAALRGDLVREVALDPVLRPRVTQTVVRELEGKLQRTAPGWAPRSARELLDHVVERILIPVDEWAELIACVARDLMAPAASFIDELADRLVAVALREGVAPSIVCAVESVPAVGKALGIEWHTTHWFDPRDLRSPCSKPVRDTLHRLLGKRRPAGAKDGLAELVGDWLASYGPIDSERAAGLLGLDATAWELTTQWLVESRRIVAGELTDVATALQLCDTENFERLLRMQRAGARPTFEAIPLERLPVFLARHQGVGEARSGVAGLRDALDPLMALPMPAGLWESEVLPARVQGYQTAWLDSLLAETPLQWLGCGKERIAFLTATERDLIGPSAKLTADERKTLAGIFPHPSARFGLDEMKRHALVGTGELTPTLWKLAWRGSIGNDGFAAVRRGIESGFQTDSTIDSPPGLRGARRPRAERWRSGLGSAGSWRQLDEQQEPPDPLEAEELARERARLVLDRWGVVFRELVEREVPALQWAQIARTLRRMELGGEVVASQFFLGVPGLQFASRQAMKTLRDTQEDTQTFWVCAVDPVSPCGLGLAWDEALPRRLAGNHLVYAGGALVVISENRARRLRIRMGVGDPRLASCLAFLGHMLTRQARAEKALRVESINEVAASRSEYRPELEKMFLVSRDRQSLVLMRKY